MISHNTINILKKRIKGMILIKLNVLTTIKKIIILVIILS